MYHGERLNSIVHLVGVIFALMAFGSLLTAGIQTGDATVITGFSIFGFSMVLMYTISTLYHSVRDPGYKRILKALDHISIYLFIAGTYTPVMLISLAEGSGMLILSIVWGFAVIGILSEVFLSGLAIKTCQIIIYLGMGWACSLDFSNVRAALPQEGFYWLLSGGIAYTVGVAFYILDKLHWLRHAHGIWHLFVLAGSICHYILIMGFVR
jgi:hemolysin III